MTKAKVSFKPVRIASGIIMAECPGVEPVQITGFKSKTEIDEWMNSGTVVNNPVTLRAFTEKQLNNQIQDNQKTHPSRPRAAAKKYSTR